MTLISRHHFSSCSPVSYLLFIIWTGLAALGLSVVGGLILGFLQVENHLAIFFYSLFIIIILGYLTSRIHFKVELLKQPNIGRMTLLLGPIFVFSSLIGALLVKPFNLPFEPTMIEVLFSPFIGWITGGWIIYYLFLVNRSKKILQHSGFIRCPACYVLVSPAKTICPSCRFILPPSHAADTSENESERKRVINYCIHCEHPRIPNAKYCINCGIKIQTIFLDDSSNDKAKPYNLN